MRRRKVKMLVMRKMVVKVIMRRMREMVARSGDADNDISEGRKFPKGSPEETLLSN